MLNRILTSISIKTKLIVATAPCLIALLVFASMFGWGQIQKRDQMNKAVQMTLFAESVGDLVHEIQKERGRTAGFVSADGASDLQAALKAQQRDTDASLASFRGSLEEANSLITTSAQKDHFNQVSRLLDGLERHRNRVESLMLGVSESVGEYSRLVDALILLVHDESGLLDDSNLAMKMQGLISLMRAKEAAGLERAQGNAAYASGEMPLERH